MNAPAHKNSPVRWAWVPVPVLLVGMIGLWAVDLHHSYEAPNLLLALNFIFSTLASLAVAVLLGRSFLARSQPGILLMGCGVLIWGAGSFVAPIIGRHQINIVVTTHNLCVWLAAGCLLGGMILARQPQKELKAPRWWLAAGGAVVVGVVAWVAQAAASGWTPVFFVQGGGGTMARQFVLGSAISLLALTAGQLWPAKGKEWSAFTYWYALGLLLLALGLFGVMIQTVAGGLLGWAGRGAQFLGGAYLIIAALAAVREDSFPALALEIRPATPPQRYLVAIAAVITAAALRLAFLESLGLNAAFVTFFPAVIFAALYGGLWPGLFATLASALVVDYFWMEPTNSLEVIGPGQMLALGTFCLSGTMICLVVSAMHRAQARAIAAEERARHATERERAQEALRQTQQENEALATILEQSSQPIAIGYQDGRLGSFNHAFEKLTGYSAEELKTMDWARTLTPPEWHALEGEKLAELTRTGEAVRYEKEYFHKDGHRVAIELLVHLARDEQGNPEYYYSFLTDITQRKWAEASLQQMNAELEQRFNELQTATRELKSSRNAALNLMEDAVRARRQAEAQGAEARHNAEQRRLALEAADLGAWDYQFLTNEVYWDDRCRRMWGIPETDHVGYSTAVERIHPEDRGGVDAAVQTALAGHNGGGYHREFRVVWPDGSVRWITSHGRVYFKGAGAERRPVRFVGANLDITAERQVREALRESEARLAAFAATAFEGILLSEEGRIVDCNEQFAHMLGSTAREVIGRTLEEFIPAEEQATALENLRTGQEGITEHHLVRLDGTQIMVESHGRPSHPDGSGMRHTAIRDITQRKQREQELQQLNRTLMALRDSSEAMLHATSEADYLAQVCEIMARDCGHALIWIGLAQEDAGKTVRVAAHAGLEAGYLDTLKVTWADNERGRGPTGMAIRTGKPYACPNMATDPQFAPWREEALKRGFASSLVLPLLDDGRAFGAISIYSREPDPFSADEVKLLTELGHDVAYCIGALRLRVAKEQADQERERARAALVQSAQELERSNRDLEQFAYVASHDLQEPLRAVGGYVKLLERRLPDTLDAKSREYIDGAFDGAVRMERLIHDLLAYSRIGTRGGNFALTDLETTLQWALNNLQTSLQSAQAKVTHDPLPALRVDATQLMQLFQNLIGNALKFTGAQPPTIHVGAQKQGEGWVFSVKDNGIGIELQYYQRIFQIFQRLHTRKQYPGTGMGLAICKRIVERHGGTIWVESKPGEGSTFYFSIPTHVGSEPKT